MEKTMKVLKASNRIIRLHGRAGFSTSSSLSMFKQASFYVQQQMYKNLYESEKKKTDELRRVLDVGVLITVENQLCLDKLNRNLNTIVNTKILRSWIKEIEGVLCNVPETELEELHKDIDKLPKDIQLKELTKRKWMYMLKKSPKTGPLSTISKSLAESDDPRIEAFSSNVAELKSIICDEVRRVKFISLHILPREYAVLEEKHFRDTMRILLESRSGPLL